MALTGKNGNLKIGTANVSQMTSWKLDIDVELKDSTNFASNGWKESVSALKGWSGSSDGTWNVVSDPTGQKALQDALLNGTTVAVEFNLNGTNKYSGTAYVKKLSVDEPVDDVVKFSVDLEGTGALAFV